MYAVKGQILYSVAAIIVASTLIVVTGCANLNTVGRTTPLSKTSDKGVAIHLDAQQRLVLYSAQKYCAEPSPDALQTYASTLGFGGSIPSKDTSSLASGQQSHAGSIGLRTQSITIMRDALYRMCEAYNNNVLGDVMVATLLARSQDLTAIILAVEQLTGAVAANQVILTGTTSANVSANLVANDQALVAAQDNMSKREAAVEAETKKHDEVNMALSTARTTEEAAASALKVAKAEVPTDADKIIAAESEFKRAQEGRRKAEEDLKRVEVDLNTKKDQLENAKHVVETIKGAMDAALTNATTNTSGSGQFSVVQPRKQLSDNATMAITTAVRRMVAKVLDKSYTVESCMALLTSQTLRLSKNNKKKLAGLKTVEDLCIKLVQRGIEAKIRAISSNYEPTNESECIRMKMKNDNELRTKINIWLKDTMKVDVSVGYFLDSRDFVDMRKKAMKEFKLEC